MRSQNERPPKTGPYKKVNAYSQRPAVEQIVAVIAFLIIVILHSIFIVPPIVAVIRHPILLFLLGLNYCLILVIAYDYIYLTVKDPADPLITGQAKQQQQDRQKLKKCVICNKHVFLKSYHCMRCNRCTENFDHHCKYLNNCVGSKNYESFFRILVTLTIYLLNMIGQVIWVFIVSYDSQELEDYMISRWPVLVVGIIVLILMIGVDSLLIFHIYLSLVRRMTTLEYIFRETPSNESSSESRTSSDQRPQTQNRMEQGNRNI